MLTLHSLRGQKSSARAAKLLRKAGVHFGQVFHNDTAKDWSDLRDSGPARLPALTMYGSCYAGLPAIKTFVKQEVEDREAVERCADESYYAADG